MEIPVLCVVGLVLQCFGSLEAPFLHLVLPLSGVVVLWGLCRCLSGRIVGIDAPCGVSGACGWGHSLAWGLGRASRGSGWVPKGSKSEFPPPSPGGSDGAKTWTFCNFGVKAPVGGKIDFLIGPSPDVDALTMLSPWKGGLVAAGFL